jgi:hypothetical protein
MSRTFLARKADDEEEAFRIDEIITVRVVVHTTCYSSLLAKLYKAVPVR